MSTQTTVDKQRYMTIFYQRMMAGLQSLGKELGINVEPHVAALGALYLATRADDIDNMAMWMIARLVAEGQLPQDGIDRLAAIDPEFVAAFKGGLSSVRPS